MEISDSWCVRVRSDVPVPEVDILNFCHCHIWDSRTLVPSLCIKIVKMLCFTPDIDLMCEFFLTYKLQGL